MWDQALPPTNPTVMIQHGLLPLLVLETRRPFPSAQNPDDGLGSPEVERRVSVGQRQGRRPGWAEGAFAGEVGCCFGALGRS